MDEDFQEQCCSYRLVAQDDPHTEPMCPCSFCGGCYGECGGECEPDTSEAECDCRPGMLCECKYVSMNHTTGSPLHQEDGGAVLPEHQGDASVGDQGGLGGEVAAGEQEELEPEQGGEGMEVEQPEQGGEGMEVAQPAAGFVVGNVPGNWIETMTGQQQRIALIGQAAASSLMKIIRSRGARMFVGKDRWDHPAVAPAAMSQLLQEPKRECDIEFADMVIVQVTSMAHIYQAASGAALDEPCVGLACSVHGPCSHISDGCFQPPILLHQLLPNDMWWDIPGIMQHMDLRDINSMVSVLFTWGFYPSMHSDHFLRAVRMFKSVYYQLMPRGEGGDAKRRWCRQNIAELNSIERGYDSAHHLRCQQQMQALHAHLCPGCPQIAPRPRMSNAEATNLRREQQRQRYIRVRENVGEQLAAELLFLAPAAAEAAAGPGAVVLAAGPGVPEEPAEPAELAEPAVGVEAAAPAPTPIIAIEGSDWGPPLTPKAAEFAVKASDAERELVDFKYKAKAETMWGNVQGACLIIEDYLRQVNCSGGNAPLTAAIVGWWCTVGWEMILVKVGEKPARLSLTQFRTYPASMFLGYVHDGGVVYHPSNPQQVVVDLSQVYHSVTKYALPAPLL